MILDHHRKYKNIISFDEFRQRVYEKACEIEKQFYDSLKDKDWLSARKTLGTDDKSRIEYDAFLRYEERAKAEKEGDWKAGRQRAWEEKPFPSEDKISEQAYFVYCERMQARWDLFEQKAQHEVSQKYLARVVARLVA